MISLQNMMTVIMMTLLIMCSMFIVFVMLVILIAMHLMTMIIAMLVMDRHCQLDDCWEVRGQLGVGQESSWGQHGGNKNCLSVASDNTVGGIWRAVAAHCYLSVKFLKR